MSSTYFVIDTEGHPLLQEISILDDSGTVIYEAFTLDIARRVNPERKKPLVDILSDIRNLIGGVTAIAHNAEHEQRILRNSYASVGLIYPKFSFECTFKLTQALFPDLESYGLELLCHHFDLGSERFSADHAHVAAYDASYTYYLYRHLRLEQHRRRLNGQTNPFSSTRVDTPFQSFVDATEIYSAQFHKLKTVLNEVSKDQNQQSRGVVLLGEPGSGKTHLMMRLANEVIQSNRVLFIRQPTNVNAVFYHIYARILESLVERVDQANHSQLELLLMRSIRSIIVAIPESDRTQRDTEILTAFTHESLADLGREGSNVQRERWLRIEKRVLEWWSLHLSLAGYREQILKGLLRFCRYSDPNRREVLRRWLSVGEISDAESERFELTGWRDRANQEEFSLQAVQILGELSTLDKPLLLVFDQLEGLWQSVNYPILIRFGEVLKELFTHVPNSLVITTLFPDRWQQFQQQFDGSITERVSQYVLSLDRPNPEQLQSIVQSRLSPLAVNVEEIFNPEDLQVILQQQSIRHCLNRANEYYAFRINDEPLPVSSDSSLRPAQLRNSEIEQRVALLERKLSSLYDLVKSLASEQQLAEQPHLENIVEKIEQIESISTVDSQSCEADIQRYLSAQTQALQLTYSKPQIITDEDDAGKLRQICDAFSTTKSIEIDELRLGRKKLPEHILISDKLGQRWVGFLHTETFQAVNARLANLNTLVAQNLNISFILIRDQQFRNITSQKASMQLTRFKNAPMHPGRQTHYEYLNLKQRVEFELAYKLVTDIVNRDLEVTMAEGLSAFVKLNPKNWIVKLLARAEVPPQSASPS